MPIEDEPKDQSIENNRARNHANDSDGLRAGIMPIAYERRSLFSLQPIQSDAHSYAPRLVPPKPSKNRTNFWRAVG